MKREIKMKKCIAMLVAMMMAFALVGCGSSSSNNAGTGTTATEKGDAITIDISVDASQDELIYKYAVKFADELENLSGGAMKGIVYANGTLGGDSEALQSCADGTLDVVLSTTAPQVSIMPKLAMFDLPNLFTNISQFRALFENEEFYQKLDSIYKDGGYQLLGISDSGFRVMSSNVKVEKLADLRGIKIRTMQNSNHIAIWQAFGANPTPLSFSEVYIGLQQGTIDAQENPIEVLVSSKFYEQQKYMISTNHLPHALVMLMSSSIYSGLSSENQEIVQKAAETATTYARELSDSENESNLTFLQEQGVEVVTISDEVLGEMKTAAQLVYDSIKGQIGDEYYNLMIDTASN